MHHQFTVIVDTEIDSEQQIMDIADALGNSGCLDSSVGGHPEGVELIFNREADSLDSALKSAISDIESAGYRVKRVEMAREALS